MGKALGKTLDPDTIIPWLTTAFPRNRWRGLLAGAGEDDCGVIRLGATIAVLSTDFLNATPIAEQLGTVAPFPAYCRGCFAARVLGP
jgi:hypothetical protein